MNTLQLFSSFKGAFERTKLWDDMVKTVENSPWHREANVAVHTEMTIDWYVDNLYDSRTSRQQALTMMALLFHDTGKPAARTEKYSEERGTYYSYPGHEQISARVFEDYAVTNWNKWQKLKETFNFSDYDLYVITWMIENHLPYGIKKPHKKEAFDLTAYSIMQEDLVAYRDMLLADSHGRISDDAETKLLRLEEWIEDFDTYSYNEPEIPDGPELVVLIGASGSGKSTVSKEYLDNGYSYYSLDALRMEFAYEQGIITNEEIGTPVGYKKAFDYCNINRSGFNGFGNDRFMKFVRAYDNIIIDNVNTSKKSRNRYVQEVKKRGYKITMVTFPINKLELLKRQASRVDKEIPVNAVLGQYDKIAQPWLGGEAHTVLVKPYS